MDLENWSKGKPELTKNGYYAFRISTNPDDLTLCYVSNGTPLLAVSKTDLRDPEQLLERSDGEWFGPLRFPR